MIDSNFLYEQETLDFIQFAISRSIPDGVYPQRLKVEQYRDMIRQWTVTHISWMLLGKKIETRKYPATWWDAFKNRWYPHFLKTRFPVKWDEFRLYNICPHINHAFPENEFLHFNWIKETSEFTTKEDNDG